MATEKTRHGPGWDDVRQYLSAICETHDVAVRFYLIPGWRPNSSEWLIVLSASLPLRPGRSRRAPVEVQVGFPTIDHVTIEAAAYSLCYKLDWELGKHSYAQARLV